MEKDVQLDSLQKAMAGDQAVMKVAIDAKVEKATMEKEVLDRKAKDDLLSTNLDDVGKAQNALDEKQKAMADAQAVMKVAIDAKAEKEALALVDAKQKALADDQAVMKVAIATKVDEAAVKKMASLPGLHGTACALPGGKTATLIVKMTKKGVVTMTCGEPVCAPAGQCCADAACSSGSTGACAFDGDCSTSGATCHWARPEERFQVDVNGEAVTDLRTCLMWERKTTDPTSVHWVEGHFSWADAGSLLVGSLNGGSGLMGFKDWRLPTSAGDPALPTGQKAELESIRTPGCTIGPCIDSIFGPTETGGYWSSSTYDPAGAVWVVSFSELPPTVSLGTQVGGLSYARAVRSLTSQP
jgi:hypothetical protein